MIARVDYSQRATAQLDVLYLQIAVAASPAIADRYLGGLLDFCDGLTLFPHRGNLRDDIRPGLRITNYRKRTVIAFTVQEAHVVILGVYHGGQDYEDSLRSPHSDEE